jgi:enoyl-CoA hydratase
MGLVNRLAEKGGALRTARELAAQIAAFPQRWMRSDRMSTYEGWTMPQVEAMVNEYRHGIDTVNSGETREGAARFAAGAGRHGAF